MLPFIVFALITGYSYGLDSGIKKDKKNAQSIVQIQKQNKEK